MRRMWPQSGAAAASSTWAACQAAQKASFEQWVEKCLAPTLSKGDIVVMDNLSSHKGPEIEKLIKAVGAELRYLPPYSPDMNHPPRTGTGCQATPSGGGSTRTLEVPPG